MRAYLTVGADTCLTLTLCTPVVTGTKYTAAKWSTAVDFTSKPWRNKQTSNGSATRLDDASGAYVSSQGFALIFPFSHNVLVLDAQ